MKRIKNFFNRFLAEIITVTLEILVIALAQVYFDYGARGFIVFAYLTGIFHRVSRKIVGFVLTKI